MDDAVSMFSWTDSFHAAVSSCFPCFRPSFAAETENSRDYLGVINTVPRARSDELQGLLADSDDAETMSMHSNIGDERRRKRKRHRRKGIRLFGWDLFGRPPVQLSEDEGEGLHDERRERPPKHRDTSTTTLDSDASALDPSAIEELSAAQAAERLAAVESERRAKEERRRLRRERRARKRASLALTLEGPEEFEGFQGSGPSHTHILPQLHTSVTSRSDTPSRDEFGPFIQGRALHNAETDDADFGAEMYVQRPRPKTSSGVGSDSRSRTTSNSNTDSPQYNHHFLSQLPETQSPASHPPSPLASLEPRKKRSRSSKKSVSSTSQSVSLPSPPPQQAAFTPMPDIASASPYADSPIHLQNAPSFQTPNAEPKDGFPSTGLLGRQRTNSDKGVFLAHRGDE